MSKYWIFILLILILNVRIVTGQEYPRKEIDLSRITDELVGFQDMDANYEEIYENLMQLLANPIDLNKASAEDLRALYLLSEEQMQSLIKYRSDHGNFISVYELQAVPELDLQTIYRFVPFISIKDPHEVLDNSLVQRVLQEGNTYFMTRYEQTLETKEGFRHQEDSSRQFNGSPGRIYSRFRTSRSGDFSIGFTAEKDAGEQWKWDPTKKLYGPDFLSGHVQLLNKARIRNFILGDFQCQFGQGLVLGGVFGLGKGAETITTTRRSNVGMLPYSSVNESGFYRGSGITYQAGRNVFVTAFYSSTTRDASIQGNNEDGSSISTLQYSGLHRNDVEMSKRKNVTERIVGGVINYRKQGFDGGLTFQRITFGEPINKKPSVYNQFTFQGSNNINTSAFFNFTRNNVTFFSEAARSATSRGIAAVAGLLGSVDKNLDISLVYRKFDRNYYSFYANAFAESSQPQNESGFYWGWKYSFKKKYVLAGYYDLFRFPWLGFRRYAPAEGYEWLAKLSYQPAKKVLLFAQAREESKARNSTSSTTLYATEQVVRRNYWLNAEYGIGENLKLRTRAQFSNFATNHHTTSGMVLLQDINFNVGRMEWTARYAIFDTDDYDNRQYVYESDVWMSFSLPAYYGTGVRNYIMCQYRLSKVVSIWARFSHIRYTDRTTIGSGLDTIAGNQKNDIKFQLLIRL